MAAKNIIRHGDTDIFPHTFESHAFFDREAEFVKLIEEYESNFDDYLVKFPPVHINALTPVSYLGFRWASQLDPIWNAHFLATVLSISEKIEAARIPPERNCVFSYRIAYDPASSDLFGRDYGWKQFMEQSLKLADEYQYAVVCDISEFYPRIGHHRIENALKQAAGETSAPSRIMNFLSNFTNTKSFGLPIGGPAARILSELTINQIDRLLVGEGVRFTRFSDDYHLFAKSREEAYKFVIFLSEKLFENQGLSLQKSKTRIMTAAEFKATNLVVVKDSEKPETSSAPSEQGTARKLLSFSLRFDPYSPTADDDYERLKKEIRQFDVMGLLKEELTKSRIHVALSRKLISAVRFLEGKSRDDVILSMLENADILYPIFSSVLILIDQIFSELSESAQVRTVAEIVKLVEADSHIMRVDVTLCFALRVLRHRNSVETNTLLQKIYKNRTNPIIRRDIILIMANWGDWYWLSDIRNGYRQLSGPEKRAFILASFSLKDEGKHWRNHTKGEFNPFDAFIAAWASERASKGKLGYPL